eukprot:TRINITY_DN32713_c0_g1_i1.p1 TRINITY_DN32713_c0_g1~~TRINITY_DN32713_c0_g1_i1.p1  ORF type:complete len:189 (-),score=-12.03 TRINITY_DN32713_c0_g1_i1:199-732(-)
MKYHKQLQLKQYSPNTVLSRDAKQTGFNFLNQNKIFCKQGVILLIRSARDQKNIFKMSYLCKSPISATKIRMNFTTWDQNFKLKKQIMRKFESCRYQLCEFICITCNHYFNNKCNRMKLVGDKLTPQKNVYFWQKYAKKLGTILTKICIKQCTLIFCYYEESADYQKHFQTKYIPQK